MKHPLLNTNKSNDFEVSIKELVPSYLPEWKPTEQEAGWAVAKAFSKMSEEVAQQLNLLPQKLFLSYLDLLEIAPTKAQAAQTPVQFSLRKKGANAISVPQKTQLMAQSKAVFETQSEFTAQKAMLSSCYFFNAQKDTIIDIGSQLQAKKDAPLDSQNSLQKHELYIRDDKLFLFKKSLRKGQYINLQIPYLYNTNNEEIKWFYWGIDKNAIQRWIAFEVSFKDEKICLKKQIPSASMPTKVNNEEGYWIKATLDNITQPIGSESFEIEFNSESSLDASFTNDVPIELNIENFYPFGKEPKLADAWYLASAEAFSKSGHSIKLNFKTIVPLDNGDKVTLSWEYNDGKTWQPLKIDNTKTETDISFTVPQDINLFKYNDIENYWIRVRIIAGGYAQTTNNTLEVITKESETNGVKTTTFDITQNALTTTYTAPKLTFNCITVNGLTKKFNNVIIYDNHNHTKYNQLPNPIFTPLGSKNRTLYLGFNQTFESGLVSLFFAVQTNQLKSSRTIEMLYLNNHDKWIALKIEDQTQALQQNGTIGFLAPSNQKEVQLFDTLAYWIKIQFIDETLPLDANTKNPNSTIEAFTIALGESDEGDVIQGIYPNTVWAKQSYGGELGENGEAESIRKLITTLPAIKEVINPLPITGGAQAASNETLIDKAPAKIRHRNDAINHQDIEALVYEVSPNIARAKLFLSLDRQGLYHSGGNMIVIVPFLDEPMPKPSFLLRQQVEAYLRSRIAAVSSLEIIAPEYVSININATLHTKTVAYADRIEEDTRIALNTYLHPLSGKVDSSGWAFGEALCLSDVIGWLERIQDVEYISHIEVMMQSKKNQKVLSHAKNHLVTLPPYALIASGVHTIQVKEV